MPQRSAIAIIDAILVRGIIPLWVLTGAVFKLIERNPGNLPKTIRDIFVGMQQPEQTVDWLMTFMRAAIAVEIIAAAIMIFVPKLSRTVAIAILSLFVVILIAEIANNATSCGCLGAVTITPTTMITIDGTMLLGAIVLGILRMKAPKAQTPAAKSGSMGLVVAGVASVLAIILAVAVPKRTVVEVDPPQPHGPIATVPNNTDTPSQPQTPTQTAQPAANVPPGAIQNPNPAPLPDYYLISNPETWVGKPATDIDLVKLMRFWPADIATGTRHIIFYSRTCDHCEAMFYDHLVFPVDRPVTVVEIPFDRKKLRGPGAWEMPDADVQQLALPVGSDWLMTPPIIITIENGKVTCAMEGQYEDCMGVEPTHEH